MSKPLDAVTAEDTALEQARTEHLQKYLRETEQSLAEQLAERYGNLVPPERLEAFRNAPTRFEEREEFDRNYYEAGGSEPRPDEIVEGWSQGAESPAHVALDHLQVPKTTTHEMLHRLSDPRSGEVLGRPLDEGLTEDLAIENLGVEPLEGYPQSYPAERAAAHRLREIIGDSPLEQAYFRGDERELREALDRSLGKGALDRLRENQKDWEEVEGA